MEPVDLIQVNRASKTGAGLGVDHMNWAGLTVSKIKAEMPCWG